MSALQREPTVHVAAIPTLAEYWVTHAAKVLRRARSERGRSALAVPGGSVAERLLPALAEVDLEWTSVDVFFCDERCVPPDDPDSNFAASERFWLAALRDTPPRVHRMRAEIEDTARAAREYAATMRSTLGTPPVLDLALVGVGEDGHVASLFPGRPSLSTAADQVVLVEDAAPKHPARRLTLSLEVLAASRAVVVAAFGSAKAAAVQDALRNPDSILPVALLLRRAARAMVLLDEDAARRLPPR
jgi:6-phosphogluconolactonase